MTAHAITQWLEGLGLGQYAEAFRSQQIDSQTLSSLTEQHLERLGVAALGHRVRILQAIAELDAAPADAAGLRDLIQRLPTPVALPLAEYVAEPDPRIKLWSACDAVEDLLRLLVFLGVGELSRLSSEPSQVLPDRLRRAIHRMIEAPTLGSWRRMAEEIARHVSAHPSDQGALPELLSSVVETLAPFLDGPAGERTPERSFLVMRNRLAHGSIGKAQSAKLLTIWQPDFEALWLRLAWLTDLHLVVRRLEGFGVLRGPTTSPLPFEPEAQPGAATSPIVPRLEEQLGSGRSVLALRGEHIIPLWPLALFDVPQHPFDPSEPDTPPLPQVYARLGQVNLQYHPLGDTGILQSEPADEAGKERFLALFRPSASRSEVGKPAGFTVKGFEESFRSLAPRLIGREPERAALRRALDETPSGVLWLDGPAGMGKSYLVAHLADELLRQERPDTLVLGYQFRADDARCARDPFLRFAIERIAAFLGQNAAPAEENTKPLNRLKSLIDALADDSEGGRRLIFLLDGLDEIAERDRSFVAEIPRAIRAPTLTWVCAGRPEQGLPEAFAAASARRVFPQGLPRMSTDDIRAMLMAFIGPLRKTLLRRDTEEGERIANPFIDKVARRSEGLPLYVKYVVEDILARRYRVLDAGETLPPGLDAYHAELIRRLGIGDLQQVITPLAATLAVAHEPLSAPALAELLHRRARLVPEGEPGIALVRKALGLIQSMIRGARTPADRDGRDEQGYVLYHYSLAQHMALSPECGHAVDSARRFLAEQAKPMRSGPLAPYLYRRGVAHLMEIGEPGAALALLTDFDYLMDRLRTVPDPDAAEGLGADWQALVRQFKIEDREMRLWEAFFREREHILRRGNEHWPANKILLQLAVEHGDNSPLTRVAEQWLRDGHCDWVWWRNPQRPARAAPDPCIRVFDNADRAVSGVLVVDADRVLSWPPLKLWDWRTGECLATLAGHEAANGAALLPFGRLLTWDGYVSDATLQIRNAHDGSPLLTLPHPRLFGAAVLPNGNILSWDLDWQRVCLWDGCNDEPFATLSGFDVFFPFGPVVLGDSRIITADRNGGLHLWSGENGAHLRTLEAPSKEIPTIKRLDDMRVLYSNGQEHRVWDFNPEGKSFRLDCRVDFLDGLVLNDGRILAWEKSHSGIAGIFDPGSGEVLLTLLGHIQSVWGMLELPGQRALSWSADATLRLWDITTGNLIRTFAGHGDVVRGAAPLADGSTLVSWSNDGTLRLWDIEQGTQLAVFIGSGGISDAWLLGDGIEQCILSASDTDPTLRLWDPRQRGFTSTLPRHAGRVNGARALPQDRILTWSEDGTLRLWDRMTGASIGVLTDHRNNQPGSPAAVKAVECLQDGTIVSAADWDECVRAWDPATGAEIGTLRQWDQG